jgi:hypothetical protein
MKDSRTDVNLEDILYGGCTPLIVACVNGHTDVVLELIRDPQVDILARTASFNLHNDIKVGTSALDIAKLQDRFIIKFRIEDEINKRKGNILLNKNKNKN